MPRQGRYFGIVVLLAAAALLLLLVSRAWESLAPSLGTVPVSGQASAGPSGTDDAQTPQGDLPGLDEMKERTDAHARQVDETLQAAD